LAKPPKKGGLLCEARVLGFARGSWRWGCAEEWLGLKDLPKLGWRMLAVSRAQKNPELLHPGLPNITYDRNSFSRKHVGVLYLLVDIQNLQGKRQGGLKTNITEMEAVRLKSSSVGLRSKSAVTKYVGIPGIVDIGLNRRRRGLISG
jgi:hypothetical protein